MSPFVGLDLTFNGADSAQNNDNTATLLTLSSVLDPARYPLWADARPAARWLRPFASPFDPRHGEWFLAAGADDAAYKRLLKPFTVPAGGATVKLSTSFGLEPGYDYLFVEIHTAGQDDWTTLVDATGHTNSDPGLSCPSTGDGSNWPTNHPFLAHYQTLAAGGASCVPTGSSGSSNAATGNSGGWREWSLPIPARFHGQNVEIAVSVVTDPAVLGLGAWIDKLASSTRPRAPSTPRIFRSRPARRGGRCPDRPLPPARQPVIRDRMGPSTERAVRRDPPS